jgi:hypothetical protein
LRDALGAPTEHLMTDTFLNDDVLRSFSVDDFLRRRPFPWWSLDDVLRPEAFDRLCADFPPLELFEWHEGRDRNYGQRPHDRYYLAYKSERYPSYAGLPKAAFPTAWQEFLTELETSPAYERFIAACLGRSDLMVRYTFHLGVHGSEVSPHVDKGRKVGTHIYYFNTASDWDPAWGGETVVLEGRRTDRFDPDFDDFAAGTAVENVGNRSFLFKNDDEAWHGVRPLTCPEGSYRRLFNVIFERPDAPVRRKASALQRMRRKARAVVSRR